MIACALVNTHSSLSCCISPVLSR